MPAVPAMPSVETHTPDSKPESNEPKSEKAKKPIPKLPKYLSKSILKSWNDKDNGIELRLDKQFDKVMIVITEKIQMGINWVHVQYDNIKVQIVKYLS
jgi:hypothetical protein